MQTVSSDGRPDVVARGKAGKQRREISAWQDPFGIRYEEQLYASLLRESDAFCLLESKVLDQDEVNYLAKLMDGEDTAEKNTLFAVTACEGYDTPKELINLHFNLGCYTLNQRTIRRSLAADICTR